MRATSLSAWMKTNVPLMRKRLCADSAVHGAHTQRMTKIAITSSLEQNVGKQLRR